MTDVRPGGHRRIDRVLAPTYLDGLADLPIEAVQAKRQESEQEEVDLSYLRRLLHGRIDIVRAEQARRAATVDGAVVDQRPGRMGEPSEPADAEPVAAERSTGRTARAVRSFGRMRHFVAEPARTELRRRRVERLVADVDLADVAARTDDELERVLRTYQAEERQVSDIRARVQQVLDRCVAELARRYSEGEARVAELLDQGGWPRPDGDQPGAARDSDGVAGDPDCVAGDPDGVAGDSRGAAAELPAPQRDAHSGRGGERA